MADICMLSVIVPTYNERENIIELIERIELALKDLKFEVIVVDDNSPDGTADAAEELNKAYGNVRVHRRPGKMGLASAIMDGINLAKSDVAAVIDADLQHPPEVLPEMFRKIMEGNDLVIASRYVEGGGIEGWGLGRRLVSKGATWLAHFLISKTKNVKDVMSGYFMLRKSVVEGMKLTSKGYKILLEILANGKYRSVVEVPYTFKPRLRGESKLKFNEILNYIRLLLKLKMKK